MGPVHDPGWKLRDQVSLEKGILVLNPTMTDGVQVLIVSIFLLTSKGLA